MRPASIFLIIQLSNSRADKMYSAGYNTDKITCYNVWHRMHQLCYNGNVLGKYPGQTVVI